MVEKELLKGEQLVDCYYASHLQYLIKSQREQVMVSEPEAVVLKGEQDRVDLDADDVVLKEEQDRVDLDADEVVLKEEQDRVDLDADKVVLKEELDRADLDAEKRDRVDLAASDVNLRQEEKGEAELGAEKVGLREQKKGGVELDAELKEKEDGDSDGGDVKMSDMDEVQEQESDVLGGPNVELTLGQDVGEREEVKDAVMMDVEDGEEDEEQEQEMEQRKWPLNGKNDVGEHFMQRCNVEDSGGFDSLEERKEEDDEPEGDDEDGEEEAEDGFDVGPSEEPLGGDGLTGNFLQALETNQIAFGSQGHLHDDSSIDLVDNRHELPHMATGGPPFYSNNEKREIEHEHDVLHHSLNGSNKRMRIDGQWDHKPLDFGTCMDQMQQLMDRARVMYEQKEQALEQSNMNQQILLNEVQKRDNVVEHLHKMKCEEMQKRDAEIYRLQRELYLMGNLLDDYKKALKKMNKACTEYRQKFQLPEEPIYKDAGPGGVVLSTSEIEKQRLKQEEEYKLNCSILEQKAKEAEEGYALLFGDYSDKVLWLDKRLTEVENGFKELRELYSKPKDSETEQNIVETAECPSE